MVIIHCVSLRCNDTIDFYQHVMIIVSKTDTVGIE